MESLLALVRKSPVVASSDALLMSALSVAKKDGLVCEFGTYQCGTINKIAKRSHGRLVHGFDSFEGLPERWREGYDKGTFATSYDDLLVHPNVRLNKGWFNETLPVFLKRYTDAISFLHVDCDLYSSTKTIFELAGQRMHSGTVVVFDEFWRYPGWEDHEAKAFAEFVATRSAVKVRALYQTDPHAPCKQDRESVAFVIE